MVIVKTVTFEVKKEAREKFEAKFKHDAESLANWETCLANEVWIAEKEAAVILTAISKWHSEDDFKAWMKRPEHAQEHKAHAAERRSEDSPLISKNMMSYEEVTATTK
ncbi:antibiotic biosynthesis monooxygenase family protein [Streptococcus caprae]|uniref:Antibiotic biosynthesis monooxygenase family protein n=1 Tax=Streptococcus caprae TaxID=1640501 RepID=A0ABV8CV26_9STRE